MTTPTHICPVCGHPLAANACDRCHGSARSLDGRATIVAARGAPLLDFVRGLREVLRALFALLHSRVFVGLLRVPVAMNALAFTALAVAACLLLLPLFESCFASSWGVFDGLRSLRGQNGSVVWLATTWLLLAPPLLDVIAGPAQEPLLDAAERAMLGTRRAGVQPHALLRLRDRATLAAAAVVALPVVLALSLVPWIGLPIVGVLGSAMAAAVWFEPPMAHRGLRLRARLLLLWRNRWRALGVGAGLQLAAVVPFLNLLGLSSVAALATASAFLQFEKRPEA